MAIDWILGEAGLAALLEPDQSDKLLEVLSTAVIYYSTGGGGVGWSISLGSLAGVDPCLWKPINPSDVRGYACDVDGKVIGLDLGTFACVVNGLFIGPYATRSLIQKHLGCFLSCSFHRQQ
jgi:hypothetical protein